jgi:hypothetical protein
LSLVVHALLLLLVIIFSKDTLNAHKIVVIDLTLIDHVTADAGTSVNKKANLAYKPKTQQKKTVSEEVPPVIEQKREEVKEEKTEKEVMSQMK